MVLFFLDKDVHKVLIKSGYKNVGGEWFNCKVNDVKSAIISLKENVKFDTNRNKNFGLINKHQRNNLRESFEAPSVLAEASSTTHSRASAPLSRPLCSFTSVLPN